MILKPALYVISTPIGNLADITLRAIDILTNSDVIFCEDTRVSNKLLEKYSIQVPLKIYNDNSKEVQRLYIKDLILKKNNIVSLVSDAGTPLISDPGYKLIRYLKKSGVITKVVPGPCSAIAALSISGLPTNKFIFCGFLPKTKQAKYKVFKEFSSLNLTSIFYETSNRLLDSLKIAKEILGDREATVSRELTKLYEESRYARFSELIDHFTVHPIKGEIVLCISSIKSNISGNSNINEVNEESLKEQLQNLLDTGLSAKSAVKLLFIKYKNEYSRKQIYKLANEIK